MKVLYLAVLAAISSFVAANAAPVEDVPEMRASSLRGADDKYDSDDSDDFTPRKLVLSKAQDVDCDYKDQVDVDFEFKTDDYPSESTVVIRDPEQFNKVVMEWGPFGNKNYVHKRKGQDRFCGEQCYDLYVLDDFGDGMDYGHIKVESQDQTITDSYLYANNFSNGQTEWHRQICFPKSNSGTNTGTNAPFGCWNCRCCKDKCRDLYRPNHDQIKNCKTNICRKYYGRKPCKD